MHYVTFDFHTFTVLRHLLLLLAPYWLALPLHFPLLTAQVFLCLFIGYVYIYLHLGLG